MPYLSSRPKWRGTLTSVPSPSDFPTAESHTVHRRNAD